MLFYIAAVRRTFCTSKACNATGLGANVVDNWRLKPWNLFKALDALLL